MSGECEYCGGERGENECITIVSHGFGRGNKEWIPFCSVECRVWWRRRCSDEPGEWEQPIKPGHQIRLDRFADGDFPGECTLGKIELGPDNETGNEPQASEAANGQLEATA